MMEFNLSNQYIEKKVPLIISNKTIVGQNNIFLRINNEKNNGIGETIFEKNIEKQLLEVSEFLAQQKNFSPRYVWGKAYQAGLNTRQLALIDLSLWDLLAQEANMPLYRLLGLAKNTPDTSVTISIGKKEWVYQRTEMLLHEFSPHVIKVKLGSPEGIEHDKESFLAILKAVAKNKEKKINLFVDANGGWNLKDAKHMCKWLAHHSVQFVEQPLSPEHNDQLKELFVKRPLPIYVDESCHLSKDIQKLYAVVDGVNIKLLKCGGITEALRIIHTARAFNLNVMLGCFGETAASITGAVSISSLVDHVDLDSFLNLNMASIPAMHTELRYESGKLFYGNSSGIGVAYDF